MSIKPGLGRFRSIKGWLGVVLAVGGLLGLARLLLPSGVSFAERLGLVAGNRVSRVQQSANNLRQIGIGMLMYSNSGFPTEELPPGAIHDDHGTTLHGWPTLILRYTDQVELADALDLARPWDDSTPGPNGMPSNRTITSSAIPIYRIPGPAPPPGQQPGTIGYASNAWVIGAGPARRLSSITDGLAQTILVGEAAPPSQPWGSPVHWRDPELGINRSAQGFGGPTPGGANFLFGDLSVRFLRSETPMPLFRAVCTPDGRERVDVDDLDR